jgi:tRNA pseudouridine55 synthase
MDSGFFNVIKPSGITSRDCVNRIQRRLPRKTKIGHAGTLDPLASGVLVVAVGQATRLIEYVQRMPKRYRGTFLLGRTSETEDTDGPVTELVNPPLPSFSQLAEGVQKLTGPIMQVPPAYSALKVNGRRAYDLARAGKPVKLDAREITIYQLEILEYDYPKLVLDIECSSGTYVRSLGRDLAESLGSGAVMSALDRTAIGRFTLKTGTKLDLLADEKTELAEFLLPMTCAVADLSSVSVSKDQEAELGFGRTIDMPTDLPESEEYSAINHQGQLIAILAKRDKENLGPVRYFPR